MGIPKKCIEEGHDFAPYPANRNSGHIYYNCSRCGIDKTIAGRLAFEYEAQRFGQQENQ